MGSWVDSIIHLEYTAEGLWKIILSSGFEFTEVRQPMRLPKRESGR